MSEPTEQIAERDRNNALMITNLQAEVDRLTIDRDAWRLTARTFERASAAAPRQASAMSAEADRIHVRLLAMGWLDHREDNCKTATEAAKLIRELSEESAPRQAEGPNNAGAILVRLRYAILTATNDDLSEPGTEKRTRHIARIEAMHDAMEEIVSLCAAAGLTVGETIPQEEK